MSHSLGAVRLESDGEIYYFEYNGTVDVCLPKLYKTRQEVFDNWRNQYKWEHHPSDCYNTEDAVMVTTYGGGFGWNVKVCRKHMLITDWHSSDQVSGDDEQDKTRYDNLPEWFKEITDE